MAKRKYLLDSDIKPGYWYMDKNGCKKLYLGVVQQIYGPPHFVQTSFHEPTYLYVKYDEIFRHFNADPNSIDIQDIAKAVMFRLSGRPTPYFGVAGHHKFTMECEAHPSGKIAPAVLTSPEYTYQLAFYDSFDEAKPVGRYAPNGVMIGKDVWNVT